MTYEQFLKQYQFDVNKPEDNLGEGGFAKVYRAFDEARNRYVAIKTAEVKTSVGSDLMRETQLVKEKIPTHKNIVHYGQCYRFSFGVAKYDFAILDYYPLGNLKKFRQTVQLTQAQKEQIAVGILQGIAHYQQYNVIHRDLKPQNILIAQDQRTGEYVPNITDFGISKAAGSGENTSFSNSFVGGSYLYASPEQLRGEETLRKNTDLWAWGILVYELFTDTFPFQLPEKEGNTNAWNRYSRFLDTEPKVLSLDKVPVTYQKAIQKALIFDNKLRVQNANELLLLIAPNFVSEPSVPPIPPKTPIPSIPKEIKTVVEQPAKEVKTIVEGNIGVKPSPRKEKEKKVPPSSSAFPISYTFLILIGIVFIGIGVFYSFRNAGMSEEKVAKMKADSANTYDSILAFEKTVRFTDSVANYAQHNKSKGEEKKVKDEPKPKPIEKVVEAKKQDIKSPTPAKQGEVAQSPKPAAGPKPNTSKLTSSKWDKIHNLEDGAATMRKLGDRSAAERMESEARALRNSN